jgi:hypothetical protein
MLCYFACGSLPWQGLKAATDKERNELLKERKSSLSGKDLCGDGLPSEFAIYINYTRSLRFDEKPNYFYLRKLFRHVFRSEGFMYDNVFDWTEKRFKEVCPRDSQPKTLLLAPKASRTSQLRRGRGAGPRVAERSLCHPPNSRPGGS